MKKDDAFVDPKFVYILSVPGAIVYLGYLWLTENSFGLALLGYVFLGIAFGCLLALFKLDKPYQVAIRSSALIPLIAYLFILFLGFLEFNKVIQSGSIPISGGVLPLTPASYQQYLGLQAGIAVLVLVICIILTLPFALIGVCGMFIGQYVSKTMGGILAANPKEKVSEKEIRLEKFKTASVIITALISGLVSIIIAFIK